MKVNTPIARLSGEGGAAAPRAGAAPPSPRPSAAPAAEAEASAGDPEKKPPEAARPAGRRGRRAVTPASR